MKHRTLGIIGYGAIAGGLIDILNLQDLAPDKLVILVREGNETAVKEGIGRTGVVTCDVAELIEQRPDLVVECASHRAVEAYGSEILKNGIDFMLASVGAFSNKSMAQKLENAARASGAQCLIPSGAIGGIDALGAAKLSGLKKVHYTGRKPPNAWTGTPAEQMCDLAALHRPFTFFEGTAREAAQLYPKNANVAATLAVAGLGMDETTVELIADPSAQENVHEYHVVSEAIEYSMRMVGKPSALNSKTSLSTAYSIARAIINRRSAIVV